PRRPDGRPCVRGHGGRCLAPCAGDEQVRAAHDSLVMDIVFWLTGGSEANMCDPLERARNMMGTLSRQRRYEEAQDMRDACAHLQSVRRSYQSLAEAHALGFAALWQHSGNGDGPSVRMNLVLNGRLREAMTLHPSTLEEQLETAFTCIRDWDGALAESSPTYPFVAVPQRELDSLLAVRRWFHEADGAVNKLIVPGPGAGRGPLDTFRQRLVADALEMLHL
ncbi:MAG: hypothetical protein ABH877_01575, partial [bacterium]